MAVFIGRIDVTKVIAAVLFAILVSGIGSTYAQKTDEFDVAMDKAITNNGVQPTIKTVNLKSYLDTNGSTRPLVIDLRPRAEYVAAHIPHRLNGTTATINIYYRHLGKKEALDYLDSELDVHEATYGNRDVVVYGNTRHLSRMVGLYLEAIGYAATGLRLGFSQWVDDTVMQDRFKECTSFNSTTGKGISPANCTTNNFPTTTADAINVNTLFGEGYGNLDNIAGPVTSANSSEVIRAAYDARFGNMSKPKFRMTAAELYDILDDNQDGTLAGIGDDLTNDPFILSNRGTTWTNPYPTGPYYTAGHIPDAKAVDWADGSGRQELRTLNITDFMPTGKTIVHHCWVGVSQQYGGAYYNVLGYDVVSLDWGIQGWTIDETVRATANLTAVTVFNYPYDSGDNGTNHKPYVVLTSPSDGDSFTTSTITFNASVWDMEGGNLTVSLWGNWSGGWSLKAYNDSTGFITEYNFMVTVPDGVWVWNVRAEDAEGNTNWSSGNWTITVDTTPPNVTIDSPTNTTPYTTSTIWINVTAWDNLEGSNSTLNVTAELDGATNNSLFNGSGKWYYEWTGIGDGLHNITIYANDSMGNMNDTEVVYFTVDVLPPYVNGSYVPTASYTGEGYTFTQNPTQFENHIINVTWADAGTSVNFSWLERSDKTVNFTSNYTSPDGNSFGWIFNETVAAPVNVTVYANDSSGNINTSFSFTYTVVNYTVITIHSPKSVYYNATNTTINVETSLDANVTYNLNNGPTNISIDNDTRTFLTWDNSAVEGQNNLTVYAVNSGDPTDNASKNVSFYVDVTYPNISYNPDTTTPVNHSQNWIFVNVNVSDNFNVSTVTLEGVLGNDTDWNITGTSYWQNKTNLPDNDYTIKVYVTDLAGNTNVTDPITITLDAARPNVIIDSPASTTIITTSGSVDLNYSIIESNLNWTAYSLDGKPNVTLSGNTTLDYLLDGQHNVTIYANDSAGNSNSTTRLFNITASSIKGRYENNSVYIPANESVTMAVPEVNVTIDIVTNVSVTGEINITLRSSNPIGTSMTDPALSRYLTIDASSNIEGNLVYAMVRLNHTYAEVNSAGISESSLRLYKWNGSEWVRLVDSLSWVNSADVDMDNNFTWANVTSFSDYAVGGELYVPPTPPRAVSSGRYPPKIPTYAILTTSEDWRYAMMAAGFAAANDYVLIAVPTHSIDLPTRNNIKWFDELIIVGDSFVISDEMEDNFKKLRRTLEPGFAKLSTTRVKGANFFGTAVQLAKLWKDPKGIIVVRGDVFADALVASQLSAATDSPILFTMPNEIWPSALNTIKRMKLPVTIIGGEKAVSKDVEDAIKATGVNVRRIEGKDRYETAALVGDEYLKAAKKKGKDVDTITFLSGKKGEWASTLGFRSYVYDSIILYTKDVEGQAAVPTPTKNFVAEHPYISSASVMIKDGSRPKGYEDLDAYINDMQFDVDPTIHTFIMDIDPKKKDYAIDSNPGTLSITVSQKVRDYLTSKGLLFKVTKGGGGGGGGGGS